jgi:hypothetical protein
MIIGYCCDMEAALSLNGDLSGMPVDVGADARLLRLN